MYMKLLVCWPSPQISIVPLSLSIASTTFRQIAAGAFSRPPSQVPCGPYTLWKRAMKVLRLRSAQYSWQNISEMSFSQPYPRSAMAGYASDSFSARTAESCWSKMLYAQAEEEKKYR